ncbi:Pantothenate kinase [Candidatus Erwinia haradaeae]|uniref:Pantothenate kinase n=1 Tax=Candidatus Erwinia haradaeae TaxID=1922217 RepID=A0A451DJV8_9GAMM|nr:type I pantothenate kinase [Candidatus Erwinia haradaeae]VFP86968.1 Pantothenate kinase [Candidatus Erwinia haradaeae]
MLTIPPYWYFFNRTQWAELRNIVPTTLDKSKLMCLPGINQDLSMQEVTEIYLPLARLINCYITSNSQRTEVFKPCLGEKSKKIPYIISIAGSVAVGKSTIARVLQKLLKLWPEYQCVELITTDGFLYPNAILIARGLMQEKGFPSSYDINSLVKFVADLKSGVSQVKAPVYSHVIYDIIPSYHQTIQDPDILILEGLNVLQCGTDTAYNHHDIFISDFVDFSIYIDAPHELLKDWYTSRFLKLCHHASFNPSSFFHDYAKLSSKEARSIASNIWNEINYRNLQENILPTRERATLIMTKAYNHSISLVKLKKETHQANKLIYS